jgi:hypothetical protein
MNVLITDDGWMYVSNPAKDANVNVYRMFEAVWCIFTKQFFYNPIQSFAWSTERNQTCLFLSLYLSLKT